jgi:transaldolase
MPSLLELLRSTSTQVDCDTLDADVAEEHGPFVDSTSNQAIAYFELSKAVSGQTRLRHDDLIKEAAQDAKDKLWRMFPDVPKTEVLVETLVRCRSASTTAGTVPDLSLRCSSSSFE